ncbi:MAG: phosphatase PAP2 family protein [Flavobacterium sp. BFFFF2]|nr:MAG: phosphatase PAP2 family protein [Flavobacterium sp. BFFFF2]
MLESIVKLDKEAFVFLNGLGSPDFDPLWLFITNQKNWIPVFCFMAYLIWKKSTPKTFLYLIVFLAFLLLITDQCANLVKWWVERIRPCNDAELKGIIRIVKSSDSFSFFSGHAANSMASTTFIYLLLRKHYKGMWLYFLFPLIFAYSRIYLGLHFPIDILAGFIFGGTTGFVMYRWYSRFILLQRWSN